MGAGRVRIAVLGAGAIGRRHIELLAGGGAAELAAVVDPSPAAEAEARRFGVRWERDLGALLAADRPDGIIVATPNQLHVANGLEAVAAALPALIEKPLADDVAAARRLVEAAEAAAVPLLTGHHRRHNPMIRAAKAAIDAGRLGTVLSVQATTWFFKPDAYFEPEWRRRPGAGPVLANLIHDLDLMRFLCGDVAAVQAVETSRVRGHPVEESAAILVEFASGVIGTLSVSDAIVAPWSWELTTGENPAYPRQEAAFCYAIGGTHGSMTVPQLEIMSNAGARGWHAPIVRERLSYVPEDPLAAQIRNFADVIRGRAAPVVSGREGLRTLEVIAAIKAAAHTGSRVALAPTARVHERAEA